MFMVNIGIFGARKELPATTYHSCSLIPCSNDNCKSFFHDDITAKSRAASFGPFYIAALAPQHIHA